MCYQPYVLNHINGYKSDQLQVTLERKANEFQRLNMNDLKPYQSKSICAEEHKRQG